MTDLTKMKLQLRQGVVSRNSPDRAPTPPAKLMLNHGKPNFTLPRSNTKQNGTHNGITSPERIQNNCTDDKVYKTKPILKSSTFYGVMRPSLQSSISRANEDNEVNKVVLRRTKIPEVPVKQHNNHNHNGNGNGNANDDDNNDDDNVPEFIKRQRRIQERLAKENILDFENRRSGYFTQCMLSPTTNNRQSFSPTMASPAIVPAFEMILPTTSKITTTTTTTTTTMTATATATATAAAEATTTMASDNNNKLDNSVQMKSAQEAANGDLHTSNSHASQLMHDNANDNDNDNGNGIENVKCFNPSEYNEQPLMHDTEQVEEEEEVAKAIEEVNKAVAGEDDDNISNINININNNNNSNIINNYNNRICETMENVDESTYMKCNGIENEIELIIAKAAAAVLQTDHITTNNNDTINNVIANGQ